MNETVFVVLSALFLAVPVGIKYVLAFRMRRLVGQLKRRERDIQKLKARAEAAEKEAVVFARALRQMERQKQQAASRRRAVESRLQRLRGNQAARPLAAV